MSTVRELKTHREKNKFTFIIPYEPGLCLFMFHSQNSGNSENEEMMDYALDPY